MNENTDESASPAQEIPIDSDESPAASPEPESESEPAPLASLPPDDGPPHRAGFVGLAGVPNVGKSTLLNRLVGQKVSIMSNRPQTTRHRVCGILTEPGFQAVFVDVPGIPADPGDFNRALVDCADVSLRGCDFILHVRDASTAGGPDDAGVVERLRTIGLPVWQIWNKIDRPKSIPQAELERAALDYERTFFVSARTGKGLGVLVRAIAARLPEGPALYPEDEASDRDLRFLCAEFVREKLFLFLRQEIPYGLATWTESFEETPGRPPRILVEIQTEREAHKGIVIGKGGSMLKQVGTAARIQIEEMMGEPVYLELRVQVRPGWRSDPRELERLGLAPKPASGGSGRRKS